MVTTSEVALSEQDITLTTLKKFIGTPTIPRRWKSLTEALAAVMYGRELGLAPMESLQQLYIVGGSVAMSGKALSALIHQAGHQLVWQEMTEETARVKAMRRQPDGTLMDVGEFEFTWDDAVKAGLDEQETYTLYPKDMLVWRAVSRAAKYAFPDVTTGMLLPEEVGGPYINVPAEDAAMAVVAVALDAEEVT